VTADNIGRFMAVVYVEFSTAEKWDELRQQWVAIPKTTEKVISVARIQSALGDRFQITGLSSQAALHTALMLRAGSLPAPVHIAEEKILGPSMGIENIRMGLASLLLGLTLIASFMTWYYRVLGLVTNLVLLCNLALLVMMLSLIQATLTLPGIAGIVLTLGMAVDANVIIFERVRDEMCRGVEAWRSLDIGLEKATETIMDSNITTMIIGVVLFFLGSGAVKGFAVTLVLGLVTSVFTALVGTRVCLRLFYRSDKQPDLRFLLPAASKESHS
jgi:preprotein translocase subunit SecD